MLDWLGSQNGATVVSAYATAAGVLLALVFGVRAEVRAWRDRRQRADDVRRRETDERRRQATLVQAWIEQDPNTESDDHGNPNTVIVVVRNGSDDLVYDAWIYSTSKKVEPRMEVGVVGPGTWKEPVGGAVGEPGTVPFFLRFTDARGVMWLRAPNGTLFDWGDEGVAHDQAEAWVAAHLGAWRAGMTLKP